MSTCGDSKLAGVYNFDGFGSVRCEAETTHRLRGKPLCKTHWLEGLKARDKADASMRAYSNQLRNYTRI